jgi:hypothetical protein
LSRVRAFLRALGAPGVAGLGVMLACGMFYFSALAPAERELAAQRMAVERLAGRGPYRPVSADNRVEELRRFYAQFPPVTSMTDELERVHSLARDANLRLMQGEYRLDRRGAGLVAYRVTLPVRGTYGHIRSFVGVVLEKMPTASVDALRFERKKASDARIDAQVRLTLHFRAGEEP